MGKPSRGSKQEKLVLSFDDSARSEYITGFRKRRNERKLKAQYEIEQKLKSQIKQERTKRRKVAQGKVDEILQGIKLPDEFNEPESTAETVDFGTHEVFVKSDIDFTNNGVFAGQAQTEEQSNVKKSPPKTIVKTSKPKKTLKSKKDEKHKHGKKKKMLKKKKRTR